MKKLPIRKYKDIVHGQEVMVTVYEPATEDDMNENVDSEFEMEVNGEKYTKTKDLYDLIRNDKSLWNILHEEADNVETE